MQQRVAKMVQAELQRQERAKASAKADKRELNYRAMVGLPEVYSPTPEKE
jgi:hypothetical protein